MLGKLIGLQTIAIAAGAPGLSTLEQGKLFRFTLRHSVILLPAGGLIALAYTVFSAYINSLTTS
jgi:L-lactate permease